jgi:hypothetical protein
MNSWGLFIEWAFRFVSQFGLTTVIFLVAVLLVGIRRLEFNQAIQLILLAIVCGQIRRQKKKHA